MHYTVSDFYKDWKLSFLGNFALKSIIQCFNDLDILPCYTVLLQCEPHEFLFTESNAFWKSIKVTYRRACQARICSRIILKMFIKSTHLRCLRNPAYFFRSCCSTVFCILFKMILVRILYGIFRRVTPLQVITIS